MGHVVGSRTHEIWLDLYDRLIQVMEREQEHRFSQDDSDNEAAIEGLARALSQAYAGREEYARTGSLPTGPANLNRLTLCPLCGRTEDSSGGYIRLDIPHGSVHFARAIPCPKCNPVSYVNYTEDHGVPDGMPDAYAMRPALEQEMRRANVH
jgi:hypothetical protein